MISTRRTEYKFCWILLLFLSSSTGCRAYVNSTPRKILEGDNDANFQRVFGVKLAPDVTVVNSVVSAYESRLGVVTTDDFEFELLVSPEWIENWIEGSAARSSSSGVISLALREGDPKQFAWRQKKRARAWYVPKSIESYSLYTDCTSVGYLHVLVDREPVGDRLRVFVSKH